MDPLTWQAALMFARRFWKPIALTLLVLALWGGIQWHLHGDKQTESALVEAKAALAIEQADKARILAQLADAKEMAKRLIDIDARNKAEAERQLKAREKFWRDRYAHDPAAKAWSEQPVPAGVLDGLRH